jgi:TonB family protein
MLELMIVVAFFWWLPTLQQPLEKEALAIAQRVPVNYLDTALPSSPFSAWFEQIVGQRSGVVWQLGECGQPAIDPTLASTQDLANDTTRLEMGDIPACVEANAVMPDGRKVVVMIRVGSFKKGITESPGFNFAMIEDEGELYLVKRLSDLPGRLRTLSTPEGRRALVYLPESRATTTMYLLSGLNLGFPQGVMPRGLPAPTFSVYPEPPAPPSPGISAASAPNGSSRIIGVEEKSLGGVSWGTAVTKVQPRYPMAAKKVKAAGIVEVKITISEIGRVIEAKAINGHALLRGSAEDAARQWIFKPTTLNGSPMATQQILTFVFKAPQ